MTILAGVTLGLYLAASFVFWSYIFRRNERLAAVGRWVLATGAIAHLATIGDLCLAGMHPLVDAAGALNLTAWLVVVAFLLAGLKWRLAMAGALVGPLAAALLISAKVTPRAAAAPHSSELLARIGQLHLILVATGVATFALAAAVALLYLLKEGSLRGKRVGPLARLTPPLATLDRAGRWLIGIGFPIFTLAVAAGIVWMSRLPRPQGIRLEYGISAIIWGIFGGLIVVRSTIGIGGRKAAALTIVGFMAAALVLVLYAGRRFVGA